jgi:hypothetical protein
MHASKRVELMVILAGCYCVCNLLSMCVQLFEDEACAAACYSAGVKIQQ